MPAAAESWTFAAGSLTPASLASALGGRAQPPRHLRRRWYDTFDWRLLGSGLVLEVDDDGRPGAAGTATLRAASDHRVEWSSPVDEVPACSDDLPAGPWRRSLGGLLGLRALIPVAEARLDVVPVEVVDDSGKVVATVLWESVSPGNGARTDATRARVVPLRGYEPPAVRAARRLAELQLGAPPVDLMASAVRDDLVVGVDLAELRVELSTDLPAAEANHRLLGGLLATMQATEPWLEPEPDTEFLHDYRVALRRSRSLLKQADGVLPARALARWRPALKRLQQATNAVRDLDVFVLAFPEYRAALPADFTDDLEPLFDLVRDRRARAHTTMVRFIRSAGYRRTMEAYTRFVHGSVDPRPEQAQWPVRRVAVARISTARRRLVKRGRRIDDSSPAAELHEVRIRGKELRYLLELYGPVLPAKPLAAVVKELKRLQDNLGAFQDAEVHATDLMGFAEELQSGAAVGARTLMAVGLLAQQFVDQQAEQRGRFAERFRAFDSKANAALFDALLKA